MCCCFMLILFLFYSSLSVHAQINLYIANTEVLRILGFDAEFFYIRNGVESWGAMEYKLLLAEHVKTIKFQWQDKRPLPTSSLPIFYNINTAIGNPNVLQLVSFTTPLSGQVPSAGESYIEMVMLCKENVKDSSEIYLEINLTNVMEPNSEKKKDLHIKLQFLKLCDPDADVKQDDERFLETYQEPFTEDDENDQVESEDLITFYVIVSIVVTLFVVSASTVGFLHAQSIPSSQELDDALLEKEEPVDEEATQRAIAKALKAAAAERHYKELMFNLKDLALRRTMLSVENTVQEGSFGRAYVGNLINPENGEEMKVLIKTVTDQASIEQRSVFLGESIFLKRMSHHNVLPLLNVCFEENKAPLLVYPYMNRGNLKNYLRLSRTVESYSKPLTTRDIVLMSLQVAKGLLYLIRRRIIHPDVATRNCVIDEELHVKISDNGLARDFFPGDYHCLGENENRPVRWMSAESLESNLYNHTSMVWSYGVLLWELMSLAQTPYASVDPQEMLTYLKSGLRLPQPTNCPDDFFTVMACCWALSPEERPSFTQIIACLDTFINTLNAFI